MLIFRNKFRFGYKSVLLQLRKEGLEILLFNSLGE